MDFAAFSSILTGDDSSTHFEDETFNFDDLPSAQDDELVNQAEKQIRSRFSPEEDQQTLFNTPSPPRPAIEHIDITNYNHEEADDESDSISVANTDDEIAEAETIDAEFPEGKAYDYVDIPEDPHQTISTNPNEVSEAELQAIIDRTETALERMSMKAQAHLERQPLSTRILLANMANEQIFKPYKKHGSQAQLSASVMRFLDGGDTIRKPGNKRLDKARDGKLRFAKLDPFEEDEEDVERRKLKRKGDDSTAGNSTGQDQSDRIKLKIVKRGGKLVSVAKSPTSQSPMLDLTPPFSQDMPRAQDRDAKFDEAMDAITYRKTSGQLDWAQMQAAMSAQGAYDTHPDPAQALINFNSRPGLYPNPITITPLATTFSQFQLQTPTSRFFPRLPTRPISTYSCSTEPRANSELALQPYNPISLDYIWPATSRATGKNMAPTSGYLDDLNRIMKLHNDEARFMLSYYVRKYDTPYELGGGGPGGGGALAMGGLAENEPPHALFRLGIAQYIMAKAETMIEHRETDELGLTPEARNILGSVWREHPSMWAFFEDGFLDENEEYIEDEIEEEEDITVEDMTGDDEDADIMVTDTPDGAVVEPAVKNYVLEEPDPKHVIGGLNPMEKALLARACTVSVDTVEAYWEMMRDKTKAWAAMKLWCRARDKERIARAKAEGRW